MISEFQSMKSLFVRRIYKIEIQSKREIRERSSGCSLILKIAAPKLENFGKNRVANLHGARLGNFRNFGVRTQQMGSNRCELKLKTRMANRRRNDISTSHALYLSAKIGRSLGSENLAMTIASEAEAALKVA